MSAPILCIQRPGAIERAVATLRAGELVVIPTETVYGIAVLPDSLPLLFERVYGLREAKPWSALPLLLDSAARLPQLARPNRVAEQLARHFWPGAVTLILPAAPHCPISFTPPRVALRVPHFPALFPLLQAMGGVLIVGRAARSGHTSSITAQEAAEQLGDDVALILDGGPSSQGIVSTVVNCITVPPRIVQRGAVPENKLWAVLNPGSQKTRTT